MANEITDAEALDLANRLEAFLRPLIAAPAAIRKAAQVSRGIEAMEKRKGALQDELDILARKVVDASSQHAKNMADAQVEYEAKTNELNAQHLLNSKHCQASLNAIRKDIADVKKELDDWRGEYTKQVKQMEDDFDKKEADRVTRLLALDKQIADREAVLSKVKSEAKKTQDALRQAGL